MALSVSRRLLRSVFSDAFFSDLGRLCVDLHLASQFGESSHQSLDGLRFVATREVLGIEVVVFNTVLEHVIRRRQHGRRHRNDGFLGTASGTQPVELRL